MRAGQIHDFYSHLGVVFSHVVLSLLAYFRFISLTALVMK